MRQKMNSEIHLSHNPFDIVMEKLSESMANSNMKKSYQNIKNSETSETMKEAKNFLKDARNYSKAGKTQQAKKAYSESLKRLTKIQASLENDFSIIRSSGDPKHRSVQALISIAVWFIGMIIGSAVAGRAQSFKQILAAYGIVGTSTIGEIAYISYLDKKDDKKLKSFSESVKDDPTKLYKELNTAISKMISEIRIEMTTL